MSDSTAWSEQARQATQSWLDAQKALWDAWAEMAWGARAQSPQAPDVSADWQQLAGQALQAFSAAADPIARATAEQFLAAQGVMLRFAEFGARAWDAATRSAGLGGDPREAWAGALEQLRRRWVLLPADVTGAAGDTQQLWQAYLDEWRRFGQPWQALWREAPGRLGRAAAGDSAALFEMGTAYREAYQQTFGRLAASPNLGMTREIVHKLAEGFDAYVAWQSASLEYQAVLGEVWDAAFRRFGEDLAGLAERGEQVTSVRDLVTLWTRGAEQVFTDAFRGERYTLAQGRLLNATMQYRIQQRRIVEEFLKQWDLPTRGEVDEAHRRIYELRKQVKALQRQVAQLEAGAAAGSRARGRARPRAEEA